jgi:hypothetical protein
MQPPRNLRRRAQPPRSPVIPPPAFTAPSRPQSHPRARSSWSTPQSMPPSTASHRARSPLPAPAVPAPPRSPRHRAQLPIPSRSPRRLPVPAVPAPCNASAPGMEYLRRQWNCGTGWSSEHQISTLRHQISVAPPSMEGLWPRARNGAASIHVPIGDRAIHHRSPHPIPSRITPNPHPYPETFIHLPWSLSLFGSNIREFGSVSGSDGVTGVASNADAVAMWMVSCRAPCGWCSSPQATPRLRPRCPPQHPQHPDGWAARDARSSRSPTSCWVATASAAGIHHKTTRWRARSRHRSAVSRPSAPSSSMSGMDHAVFFTSALPLLSGPLFFW